jgi:sortase (surface protein transpeptidase)
MAAYDDLNVKRIFVVGIASIVVTAVTALAVQVLYYSMAEWQKSETQAASNYTRQNQILRQQLEQVSVYGVDEATGNIVIPVDKAIELMISEKSKSETSASNSETNASDET